MYSSKLLKMLDTIMQDVQKGEVDWADVEDFREVLIGVDEEIVILKETLYETIDALVDCESEQEDAHIADKLDD